MKANPGDSSSMASSVAASAAAGHVEQMETEIRLLRASVAFVIVGFVMQTTPILDERTVTPMHFVCTLLDA